MPRFIEEAREQRRAAAAAAAAEEEEEAARAERERVGSSLPEEERVELLVSLGVSASCVPVAMVDGSKSS